VRSVSATTVAVEKQSVLHNLNVCICSLSYAARNALAPNCHLWPDPPYNIFSHYIINGTTIKKKLLNTKRVFRFSLEILPEIFLILKRNGRDIIKMYIGLHVKYPLLLSDINPYPANVENVVS
jgi:hypothetical protein